tara:strand:+ start:22263 stop:22559 length:297 start_codon:yes stop_codon:yes gene_type:complete
MKSEELLKQAAEEENDTRSFMLMCKALREKRSEKFIEDYLPVLKLRYVVTLRDNGSYSIETQEFGIIDYFPKKNSLLIRKDNDWKKPGLKWIYNNLIT